MGAQNSRLTLCRTLVTLLPMSPWASVAAAPRKKPWAALVLNLELSLTVQQRQHAAGTLVSCFVLGARASARGH